MGEENDQNGRVSGAIAGREQDQNTPAARHGFLRGSGPDQQAHEQPEIVPGDMDQIALMDVPPAPQPRPAHATAVQDVSKGALNQFPVAPDQVKNTRACPESHTGAIYCPVANERTAVDGTHASDASSFLKRAA